MEKVKSGNEKRAHLETRKEEMKKTDRMKKKDESERYGEQEREREKKGKWSNGAEDKEEG